MPTALDLCGQRFGKVTVLRREGKAKFGTIQTAWRYRCDCGREEVVAQARLTRGQITACHYCRRPICVVCGARIEAGSLTQTKHPECKPIAAAEIALAYWNRLQRDPQRRDAINAARRERRQHVADKEALLAKERARDRKRREERTAEQSEAKRIKARLWYAANANSIQTRRRERLANLSDEALARWMARARRYWRAYSARRRAEIQSDPEAHRRYLDLLREYRRQQALQRMAAQAGTLTRKLTDAQ